MKLKTDMEKTGEWAASIMVSAVLILYGVLATVAMIAMIVSLVSCGNSTDKKDTTSTVTTPTQIQAPGADAPTAGAWAWIYAGANNNPELKIKRDGENCNDWSDIPAGFIAAVYLREPDDTLGSVITDSMYFYNYDLYHKTYCDGDYSISELTPGYTNYCDLWEYTDGWKWCRGSSDWVEFVATDAAGTVLLRVFAIPGVKP